MDEVLVVHGGRVGVSQGYWSNEMAGSTGSRRTLLCSTVLWFEWPKSLKNPVMTHAEIADALQAGIDDVASVTSNLSAWWKGVLYEVYVAGNSRGVVVPIHPTSRTHPRQYSCTSLET